MSFVPVLTEDTASLAIRISQGTVGRTFLQLRAEVVSFALALLLPRRAQERR
jgi:hypothetical protein